VRRDELCASKNFRQKISRRLLASSSSRFVDRSIMTPMARDHSIDAADLSTGVMRLQHATPE